MRLSARPEALHVGDSVARLGLHHVEVGRISTDGGSLSGGGSQQLNLDLLRRRTFVMDLKVEMALVTSCLE